MSHPLGAPEPVTQPTPSQSGIVVDDMSGNCPVQATGAIDGVPFYFRARGAAWSLEIGSGNTSCVCDAYDAARHNKSKDGSHETPTEARERVSRLPVWRYDEAYGEWPAAGWMEQSEAHAFIAKAADIWRTAVSPLPSPPEPQ